MGSYICSMALTRRSSSIAAPSEGTPPGVRVAGQVGVKVAADAALLNDPGLTWNARGRRVLPVTAQESPRPFLKRKGEVRWYREPRLVLIGQPGFFTF